MPMFITALFIIANNGISIGTKNQSMDKENVVYIENGVLFSYKEEVNKVIFSKMDQLEIIILSSKD
jgi:hypothetical protein